jgi:hypothetical protein
LKTPVSKDLEDCENVRTRQKALIKRLEMTKDGSWVYRAAAREHGSSV